MAFYLYFQNFCLFIYFFYCIMFDSTALHDKHTGLLKWLQGTFLGAEPMTERTTDLYPSSFISSQFSHYKHILNSFYSILIDYDLSKWITQCFMLKISWLPANISKVTQKYQNLETSIYFTQHFSKFLKKQYPSLIYSLIQQFLYYFILKI